MPDELTELARQVSKVERYKDKLLDAMGDLVHAENHVSLINPEAAKKIRDIRKRLELEVYGTEDKHPGRGHQQ